MRTGLVLLAAVMALAVSCDNRKMANAFEAEEEEKGDSVEAFVGDTLHLFDEELPPVAADELFDDFFFTFIDDSKYRLHRISFPLQCLEKDELSQIAREEWKLIDPFDIGGLFFVIYEREQDLELLKDTAVSEVCVERIFLQEQRMEMYDFNRLDGKWRLANMRKEDWLNTPNGDFLKFYAHFVSDSIFQREALSESIKVILTPGDGNDEAQEEFITKDEWFEIQEGSPVFDKVLINIDYGQTSISQNRKILMLEGVSNGLQMKFKFYKQDEKWMLMEVEY